MVSRTEKDDMNDTR